MTGQNDGYTPQLFGQRVRTKVCWLHVSDGKTLYTLSAEKQGMFTKDCPVMFVNQPIKGKHISRNGRWMQFLRLECRLRRPIFNVPSATMDGHHPHSAFEPLQADLRLYRAAIGVRKLR